MTEKNKKDGQSAARKASLSAPICSAPDVDQVAEAMQYVWDLYVSDTGRFPDCISGGWNGRIEADFQRGNFALWVSEYIRDHFSHNVERSCEASQSKQGDENQ